MTIKVVSAIPKSRKKSKFDETLQEVAKMLDKDPTRIIEVSDEGTGLSGRFQAIQKDGGLKGVNLTRRNGSVYFKTFE